MKKYSTLLVATILMLFTISCDNMGKQNDNALGLTGSGERDYKSEEVALEDAAEETAEAYEPEEANSTYNWEMGDGEGDLDYTVTLSANDVGTASFVTRTNAGVSAAGWADSEIENKANNGSSSRRKVRKTNDKIIRTGNVGLQLNDYDKDKYAVYDAIKKYDGYLSKENERKEISRVSNDLEIRVPNENFDAMVAAITAGEGIKNVDYKRISAVDVGEEFYDLQTRIKTKKEVEKRYISILKTATKIKDILAVEDQVRVIREEIESKEGRLRFLSDRISYSTIHLNIYQNLEYDAPITEKPTFLGKLANAAQSGWTTILNFLLFLVYIWPIVLLLIVTFVLYKKKLFIFKGRDKSEK